MKKRWMSIVILFVSIVMLAGCNNKTGQSESVDTTKDKELAIYVIRHGKTMLNTTDRVQGWSDAVLTPEGEDVAVKAGQGLKDIDFQNVYSSDSGRAIQTANIIMNENEGSENISVETDKGFREFNFGTYEGDLNHNMWQDIADLRGVTLEEFLAAPTPEIFANSVAELDKEKDEEEKNWPAEDYETIQKRLSETFNEMIQNESKKDGSGNIMIVSHGLSISALVDTYFDDYERPEGGFQNASLTLIKYKDGEFTLDKVGDLSYMDDK